MDDNRIKRRLAAILAADAVGYSKHMARDEEGTLRVLSGHRTIIDGLIATFSGRIVGTAGDSVLAEFGSSVDAVRCAVEIQAALATRNAGLSDDDRLLFRIGINLGDVIVEGDDILGDGVNVAARLESIAEPGGICISSSIYDQIAGKLNLGFADMGHQSLKNIGRPVRTYMVSRDGSLAETAAPAAATRAGAAASADAEPARSSATLWLTAAGAVGLVIVTIMFLGRGRQADAPSPTPAQTAVAPVSAPASAPSGTPEATAPPAVSATAPPPTAEPQVRRPQPSSAGSSTASAPASSAAGAPTTAAGATVATAAQAEAPAAPAGAAAARVFTGGTATGSCEGDGDDALTGEGVVRVEGSSLIVSFPPAGGRRAPVVARGRVADDGGVTLQVVRGGRGRGGAGGSFSGRLVDGRGTLTGPVGRCSLTLQLN